MRALTILPLLILGAVATAAPAAELLTPIPDGANGRRLFVHKGCVVCHSVNGVGGKAAPALDAPPEAGPVDPLGFAARMWRGAGAMIELQGVEFGYQIEIGGQDIADLAAFVSDPALQAGFSEAEIPEIVRGWTLDEPYEDYAPIDAN